MEQTKLKPIVVPVPEVANLLGVTNQSIRNFMRRGDLPCIKIGNKMLPTRAGVEKLIAAAE